MYLHAIIKLMKTRVILFFSTLVSLVAITVIVILWAKGYRLNKNIKGGVEIKETGILLVKSYPDGAKIYLNNELRTATNATISGLHQGNVIISIQKEGYSSWEKIVPIESGFVTTIEAVLPSITPELKPLTLNGADILNLSPQNDRIAYLSDSNGKSGVWLLSLTGTPVLNSFGRGPELLAADSANITLSAGTDIIWSPEGDELIVQTGPNMFYIISLNKTPSNTTFQKNIDDLLETWEQTRLEKVQQLLKRLTLSEEDIAIALDKKTLWSPDGEKFICKSQDNGTVTYIVHNLEKVKGVGEKETYIPITTNQDKQVEVRWYSDSNHLVVAEDGVISLIDIDGGNKRQLYKGKLASSLVIANTHGTEIIMHTSFNDNTDPNLYAIKLR